MISEFFCDFCDSTELRKLYTPLGTRRGLEVFICEKCDLVQSFPKIDHVEDITKRVSGSADWGNVRYGKNFRTKKDLKIIGDLINLEKVNTCLDIGSNRGGFCKDLTNVNGYIEFWGIEPDGSIIKDYSNDPNNNIINERVENVTLPNDYFDIIYMSHTLEHLKSPNEIFFKIKSALKSDGILYIEVPNIEFLKQSDIVEEWFIDKHLYHFSRHTLFQYFKKYDFHIIFQSPNEDYSNLSFVGTKNTDSKFKKISLKDDNNSYEKLISSYDHTFKGNRSELNSVTDYLNNLCKKNKCTFWGAGRIFDGIINYGNLDLRNINGLVDKYLYKYIDSVHGVEIHPPEDLLKLNPEYVFICSRDYFSEIKKEVLNINPKISVLGFSETLKSIL